MNKHNKLIVCSEDPELTLDVFGGHDWYVISKRADSQGYPTPTGALEERWDSEAMAITCARQRLAEGWASVEVLKTVAYSMVDE